MCIIQKVNNSKMKVKSKDFGIGWHNSGIPVDTTYIKDSKRMV